MKKLTSKPVVTYKVGDRVQFLTFENERGMRIVDTTEYGIVTNVNTVTVLVKTMTDEYKLHLSELTHYVDPFIGIEL
jgi:hypothetical protein